VARGERGTRTNDGEVVNQISSSMTRAARSMLRESSKNIFRKSTRKFFPRVLSPPHKDQTQIMTTTKFLQNITSSRSNKHKR
jgi:hypothetical protein